MLIELFSVMILVTIMVMIMVIIKSGTNRFVFMFVIVSFSMLLFALAMLVDLFLSQWWYYLFWFFKLNLHLTNMKFGRYICHLHSKVLYFLAPHNCCYFIMDHTSVSFGVNYELHCTHILFFSHFPYLDALALLNTFNALKFSNYFLMLVSNIGRCLENEVRGCQLNEWHSTC